MNKSAQYICSIAMLTVGIICMFPPPISWLKWLAESAVYIMLFYFFLGLFFLILRLPRLTFVAFGITAMLCLFLKQASS